MRVLIDGYNLVYAMGWLSRKDPPARLKWARERILRELHTALGTEANALTIVFDAQNAPRDTNPEEYYHGIRVIHALDQQADDLIEELIQKEPFPHQLTVVSNDHRLQLAARRRRCLWLSCLDYFENLHLPPSIPITVPEVPVKPEPPQGKQVEEWLRYFGDGPEDRK